MSAFFKPDAGNTPSLTRAVMSQGAAAHAAAAPNVASGRHPVVCNPDTLVPNYRFPSARLYLWDRTPSAPQQIVQAQEIVPQIELTAAALQLLTSARPWQHPADGNADTTSSSPSAPSSVQLLGRPSWEGQQPRLTLHPSCGGLPTPRGHLGEFTVPLCKARLEAGSTGHGAGIKEWTALRCAVDAGCDRQGSASAAGAPCPIICTLLREEAATAASGEAARAAHGAVRVVGRLLVPSAPLALVPLPHCRMCHVPLTRWLREPDAAGGADGSSSVVQDGFLTMDHTRSLLPLKADDANVFSIPLVGVWVRGLRGGSLGHPAVMAACLRFAHSMVLPDRVMQDGAFLLLLAPGDGSAPRCYEARFIPPASSSNGGRSAAPPVLPYTFTVDLAQALPGGGAAVERPWLDADALAAASRPPDDSSSQGCTTSSSGGGGALWWALSRPLSQRDSPGTLQWPTSAIASGGHGIGGAAWTSPPGRLAEARPAPQAASSSARDADHPGSRRDGSARLYTSPVKAMRPSSAAWSTDRRTSPLSGWVGDCSPPPLPRAEVPMLLTAGARPGSVNNAGTGHSCTGGTSRSSAIGGVTMVPRSGSAATASGHYADVNNGLLEGRALRFSDQQLPPGAMRPDGSRNMRTAGAVGPERNGGLEPNGWSPAGFGPIPGSVSQPSWSDGAVASTTTGGMPQQPQQAAPLPPRFVHQSLPPTPAGVRDMYNPLMRLLPQSRYAQQCIRDASALPQALQLSAATGPWPPPAQRLALPPGEGPQPSRPAGPGAAGGTGSASAASAWLQSVMVPPSPWAHLGTSSGASTCSSSSTMASGVPPHQQAVPRPSWLPASSSLPSLHAPGAMSAHARSLAATSSGRHHCHSQQQAHPPGQDRQALTIVPSADADGAPGVPPGAMVGEDVSSAVQRELAELRQQVHELRSALAAAAPVAPAASGLGAQPRSPEPPSHAPASHLTTDRVQSQLAGLAMSAPAAAGLGGSGVAHHRRTPPGSSTCSTTASTAQYHHSIPYSPSIVESIDDSDGCSSNADGSSCGDVPPSASAAGILEEAALAAALQLQDHASIDSRHQLAAHPRTGPASTSSGGIELLPSANPSCSQAGRLPWTVIAAPSTRGGSSISTSEVPEPLSWASSDAGGPAQPAATAASTTAAPLPWPPQHRQANSTFAAPQVPQATADQLQPGPYLTACRRSASVAQQAGQDYSLPTGPSSRLEGTALVDDARSSAELSPPSHAGKSLGKHDDDDAADDCGRRETSTKLSTSQPAAKRAIRRAPHSDSASSCTSSDDDDSCRSPADTRRQAGHSGWTWQTTGRRGKHRPAHSTSDISPCASAAWPAGVDGFGNGGVLSLGHALSSPSCLVRARCVDLQCVSLDSDSESDDDTEMLERKYGLR